MLYEKWREIAQEHRNQMALCEPGTGRRWTFAQLAQQSEQIDSAPAGVYYPKGIDADFVFAVLQAWRAQRVVCPLEGDQNPVALSGLPEGIVHLKTTSASTGEPRVVAFTPAQLMADAENIVQTMGLRPEWPNLGAISLAHS